MTANYTFVLNSLTMGPGTNYEIESVQGLDGPAVVSHDIPSISGGVLAARDIVGSRSVIVTCVITGVVGTALETNIESFATAWAPSNTDVHLTYHIEGATDDRYVIGRPRAWTSTLDQPATMGNRRVVALFFSPNGLIYNGTSNAVVNF